MYGILMAILAVVGLYYELDLSGIVNLGLAGAVVLLDVMVLCVLKFTMDKKKAA